MCGFFDGDRPITFRDGRTLGYCTLGDQSGQLVIFLGGYPGSRLMARLFEGILERGIRLVGIDRPGAGLFSRWRKICELAIHNDHSRSSSRYRGRRA